MAEVLVALSGGVDSSVAAALLQQEGHDITAVTLKLWGGETDSGCCSVSDVEDARRVAQQLGVDHHVFNFGEDFERHVVTPYVEAYAAGSTPNPCVECNRHIKFDKLFRRADALGFDLVATGHHAQISETPDGVRHVARGADPSKDQSYVLHMLGQDQLARLLLPVGAMTKERVREVASELGLRTADKADSQDVCFIERSPGRGDAARKAFLGDRIPLRPATIVDGDGAEVGRTDSIELVTIGQRKGLDLGGGAGRRYVTDIDHEAGVITVGDHGDTLSTTTEVPDLTWVGEPIESSLETPGLEAPRLEAPLLEAQCAAHGARRPVTVRGTTLVWSEPQPKVANGQSVVIYRGDDVVAGGIAGEPISTDRNDGAG